MNQALRPPHPPPEELTRTVFLFEGFTLDLTRRVLRNGEHAVELRPKSFDVLGCLVENAGQLVTKEELIGRVWPNVIVGDESLARCVSDVRQALGDRDQRLIKTLPRRGYVFTAPVSRAAIDAAALPAAVPQQTTVSGPADPGGSSAHESAGSRRAWKAWSAFAIAAALVLATAATAWLWRASSVQPLPDRPSIAVLPFANMSGDAQQDYFSDGLSEELATGLARFPELLVITRDSAFKYKGKSPDAREIGRNLGVRYVVLGSTRRDPERIRVTAQLVDTANGVQLWAERYDAGLSGLFAVQDEIVQKIVATLVARISKSELERALRKAPADMAAHDYYLRGNALLQDVQRGKQGETLAAARALYEKAVAADPRYAPAVHGLALTYFQSWLNPSPGHLIGAEFQQAATLEHAESLARRAVGLDRALAKAHATLGWILHWQNRPQEAVAAFEHAFEFHPNFVDGRFGALLLHSGRPQEAIDYLERVLRLDPFYSPTCIYYLGAANFLLARYDEATRLIRSAALRMPDHRPSRVLLAAVSAQVSNGEEARSAAAEVLRAEPGFRIADWLKSQRIGNPGDLERLAAALRKAGFPD